MRLKARDSEDNSSVLSGSSTRAVRSPPRTRSAASIRRMIGVASRVAKVRPTHIAPSSNSSATTANRAEKVISRPQRVPSSL